MKSKSIKTLILVLCVVMLAFTVSSCAESEMSKSEELSYTEAVNRLNTEAGASNYVLVSFEGLGIEPLVINKVAFRIGSFTVSWYGILMIAAIAVTLVYAFFLSKKEKINSEDIFDIMIFYNLENLTTNLRIINGRIM